MICRVVEDVKYEVGESFYREVFVEVFGGEMIVEISM